MVSRKEGEEMRKAVIVPHLSPEALKARMIASRSREQFQRWQVIYIMNTQKYRAEEVGELVGVSRGTVYQWIHLYNHKGPDAFLLGGRGGRTGGLLTWEEEEALLADIGEKAMHGLVVIAHPIREYAERKLGHVVSKDYAYDLLHRHGWRKVSPRPRHPKAKMEYQEGFKKNSPSSWKPPLKVSPRKIHDR
jgi:transposase